MKRKTKPTGTLKDQKKRMQTIIRGLSTGDWNPEERETGILFDHDLKVVHLETSYGPTARRWFKNLWGDPEVTFDDKADTFKITVPWEYCRKADLILKHKHRTYDGK